MRLQNFFDWGVDQSFGSELEPFGRHKKVVAFFYIGGLSRYAWMQGIMTRYRLVPMPEKR
jgi:hypothetical protein